MEYIKLNNGVEIPVIGIGTFTLTPDQAENSVDVALRNGYELIDTANAYVNEKGVGRGIKKSGVDRKDIFVSTKLWPTVYEDENAVDKTLERLGTEYIDLLFLHQPIGNYMAGYRQLEKAYKEGKVKAIGVSNFFGEELKEILEKSEIKPQVVQVEAHPYFTQDELREIIKPYNIKIMAWYPLGHGDKSLIEEPIFAELGTKYNKLNAQIILRWHTQMGFIVIPGASKEEHVKQNIDILDFELTDEDMQEIAKINKNVRYYNATREDIERLSTWIPDIDGQV